MSRKSVTTIRATPWSATTVTVSTPVLRHIEQLAPESPDTKDTVADHTAAEAQDPAPQIPASPPPRAPVEPLSETYVLEHRDGTVSLRPKSAPTTPLMPLPPRPSLRSRITAGTRRSTHAAAKWLLSLGTMLVGKTWAALRRVWRGLRSPAKPMVGANARELPPLGATLGARETIASLGTAVLLLVAIGVIGIAGYLAIVSLLSGAIGLPGPVSTGAVAVLALLGTVVPAWVLEAHRTSRAATAARIAAQLGLPLNRADDESHASERFLDFAALCLNSLGRGAAESALRHLDQDQRASLALLLTGAADKAAGRTGLGRTQRARLAAAGGSLPWPNSQDATTFLRGLDGHMATPEAQRAFQSGASAMEHFVDGNTDACRAVLKSFLEQTERGVAAPESALPIPTVLLSRVLSPVHRSASRERIVALHKVLLRDSAGKKSARPPQQRGALVRVAFPDTASAAKAAVAAMRAVDGHNMRYPELAMRVGMALVPRDALDPATGVNPLIREAGVAQIILPEDQAEAVGSPRLRLRACESNRGVREIVWW